jgi:rhodanese-related sulfurtransferase
LGTRMNLSARSHPLRWAVLFLLIPCLLGGCAFLRGKRPRAPYKKLSAPIAYEMMRDNPEMLVIDLRPPQEFNGETGHVRRALNIPLERLPFRLLEISAFREDTVLVYCRADGCGEKGISILLSSGFENVVLLDGGIDKWIQDGFKTVLPTSVAGRQIPAAPADGRGAVMPRRPGKPSNEVTVEPPPIPPPPPPM